MVKFNTMKSRHRESGKHHDNRDHDYHLCHDNEHRWHRDHDQGWAWMVCAAAFLSHFITLGFAFSIGVYYVVFLDVFGQSTGLTAWISSLNFGTLCVVGPVASLLISYKGLRLTLFLGAAVSTLGLLLSSYCNNVQLLLVSLGLVAGTGFGMVFTTAVVAIPDYFTKYRTIANGLSLSGAGFGTIAYPWLTKVLLESYGWRGALMISAGIHFHICIFSMVLRPQADVISRTVEPNDNNNVDKVSTNEKLGTKVQTHGWRQTLSLFGGWSYWALCLNNVLYTFGQSVVYTHIGAYAYSMKLDASTGHMLISAVGIANLFGRILLGFLGHFNCVNVSILFVASYLTAGFGIIMCGFWNSLPGLIFSITTFGLFSGAFGPLLCEVTLLIVGIDRFGHGYGYLMIFMAMGTMLGAPTAGFLYDYTHFYPASFYLGGAVLISSSFVMLPTLFSISNKKQQSQMLHPIKDINIKSIESLLV